MPLQHTDFVVVTGGPGTGKSTLIDRLAEAGYARSTEAGRGVIQDQLKIGGRALPWTDPDHFAEMMLNWELRSYHLPEMTRTPPVFFDRAVTDIIGYLKLQRRPVPEHLHTAAQTFPYQRRVFIAPPWPEIYEQDNERKQTLEEAERTHKAMVAAYTEYGYQLVELPRDAVEVRLNFVTSALASDPPKPNPIHQT